MFQDEIIIQVENLNFNFGSTKALKNINLTIPQGKIFAIFGPARSGRTTFLRTLNRLNDLVPGIKMEGKIYFHSIDIYQPDYDVVELRRRIGMVFAVPTPLPMTVFENVVYGPRLRGVAKRSRLLEIAEGALRAAVLWNEVKDRLHSPAITLSGGQQQRLCIARVLALDPEVLLLDEPCSGLDPISTLKIEDSLRELKRKCSIIIVPHNVLQAARIADYAAFLLTGELVEKGSVEEIFTRPADKRTEDYISGRFG